MARRAARRALLVGCCVLVAGAGGGAQSPPEPGLLFHLSGSRGLTADRAAGGDPEPNFASEVEVIADGASGPGLQCGHTQLLSYWAPGNIFAERGTLSFFWRSREPVAPTEFPIFRVGYADHSSWDMVWLRIDYNGRPGFDAFVTDASLARTRVSHTMPAFPGPTQWVHLALAWDETRGIRFYVNGQLVAQPARHRHLLRGARPVRAALAHHQPLPGAERLQLRPRRRHRRGAHLRPHALRRERGSARPARDAPEHPAS